jgi:hypothetical protein
MKRCMLELCPGWLRVTHVHTCFVQYENTYYFHDLIAKLTAIGYVEGSSLFGFGYDWRQVRWHYICVCVYVCVRACVCADSQ